MDGVRLIRLLAKTAKIAAGLAQNAAREKDPDTVSNGTFTFSRIKHGTAYSVNSFLKSSDPLVTSVAIPAEYKGVPIKAVGASSFFGSGYLKTVVIPESVEEIWADAFAFCPSLEKVRLPQSIQIVCESAFRECPLLPAETVMTCLCHSLDITQPFREPLFGFNKFDWNTALREDVFVLALKYHSFSELGSKMTAEEVIRRDPLKYLRLMERAGFFSDAERLNGYIDDSVQNNTPEITAWLLEYKNRTFGFDGGNNFEL